MKLYMKCDKTLQGTIILFFMDFLPYFKILLFSCGIYIALTMYIEEKMFNKQEK